MSQVVAKLNYLGEDFYFLLTAPREEDLEGETVLRSSGYLIVGAERLVPRPPALSLGSFRAYMKREFPFMDERVLESHLERASLKGVSLVKPDLTLSTLLRTNKQRGIEPSSEGALARMLELA